MTLALLLAAAIAAADACAPVAAGRELDRDAASAYAEVGAREAARGANETAAAAFRAALERDPENAAARAGLAELCRRATAERAFDDGLQALRAGRRAEAAALFARADPAQAQPALALLQGIARYELGEDAAARPLFERASADPRLASEAALFLGLLALRSGQGDEAARRFEAVARSSAALRDPAESLLALSRREGRLSLSFLAGAGFDSNADLAPDGSTTAGGDADAAATAAASAVFRPFAGSGPYLRASASFRKLARYPDFDVGATELAAGAQLGSATRLRAEYAWDYGLLGGASYLSAHRLSAEARLDFGGGAVSAIYGVGFESFLTDAASAFSGTRHGLELQLELRPTPALVVGAALAGGRDLTSDDTLTWLEAGPRLFGRLALSPRVRCDLEASFLERWYDGFDSTLGVTRVDKVLEVALGGELDFAERFTARASAGLRRALSNAAPFQYTQLTAGLVFGYALGLL